MERRERRERRATLSTEPITDQNPEGVALRGERNDAPIISQSDCAHCVQHKKSQSVFKGTPNKIRIVRLQRNHPKERS